MSSYICILIFKIFTLPKREQIGIYTTFSFSEIFLTDLFLGLMRAQFEFNLVES